MADLDPVVTTAWLAERLGSPDLRVLDATWYLPTLRRDARAEFREAHVPGAVYFDIDAIADRASPLPHMLPDAAAFARAVGALHALFALAEVAEPHALLCARPAPHLQHMAQRART